MTYHVGKNFGKQVLQSGLGGRERQERQMELISFRSLEERPHSAEISLLNRGRRPACAPVSEEAGDETDSASVRKITNCSAVAIGRNCYYWGEETLLG